MVAEQNDIETYAYPEIISICDLCVVMDRQGIVL